jgi:hypothetical protein
MEENLEFVKIPTNEVVNPPCHQFRILSFLDDVQELPLSHCFLLMKILNQHSNEQRFDFQIECSVFFQEDLVAEYLRASSCRQCTRSIPWALPVLWFRQLVLETLLRTAWKSTTHEISGHWNRARISRWAKLNIKRFRWILPTARAGPSLSCGNRLLAP